MPFSFTKRKIRSITLNKSILNPTIRRTVVPMTAKKLFRKLSQLFISQHMKPNKAYPISDLDVTLMYLGQRVHSDLISVFLCSSKIISLLKVSIISPLLLFFYGNKEQNSFTVRVQMKIAQFSVSREIVSTISVNFFQRKIKN